MAACAVALVTVRQSPTTEGTVPNNGTINQTTESRRSGTTVSYLGVVLGDDGIAEWEVGRRVVFVPRTDVGEIRLEHGWRAERVVPRLLFGGGLLTTGLYLAWGLLQACWREGAVVVSPKILLAAVLLPLLGGWILASTFGRGRFLRVRLANGDRRKILFRGTGDPRQLDRFLEQARALSYEIQVTPDAGQR